FPSNPSCAVLANAAAEAAVVRNWRRVDDIDMSVSSDELVMASSAQCTPPGNRTQQPDRMAGETPAPQSRLLTTTGCIHHANQSRAVMFLFSAEQPHAYRVLQGLYDRSRTPSSVDR